MANPRRNSYTNSTSSDNPFQIQNLTLISSAKHFLKKPHAFPLLLLIFLFLTWATLRLQRPSHLSSSAATVRRGRVGKWSTDADQSANLVRFKSAGSVPSPVIKDGRGWLLNPLSLALQFGIKGAAVPCVSIHVGEIRPGAMRGNHRHHTCNETFVIWGASTLFRLENNQMDKGYAEVVVGADEVAVAASASGIAHVLVNLDLVRSTFFIGCQDSTINTNSSNTDFNVWKDL